MHIASAQWTTVVLPFGFLDTRWVREGSDYVSQVSCQSAQRERWQALLHHDGLDPLPPILCSASVGGDVHPGLSVGISSPIPLRP